MGLQLVFVVETKKQCKSDWMYIKETIEHFYGYERTQVKLTPVYMDGKGKYQKKKKEAESKVKQYSATSKANRSKVIYCFDCDEFDKKPEDLEFLNTAKCFCDKEGYEFVWFCKDVENVYLGKRIDDKQKKKEAENFKIKRLISKIDENNLSEEKYVTGKSNILRILDGYSELKRRSQSGDLPTDR